MVVCGQTLTLEKERALGAAMAAEIRRQSRPLDIADVSSYLERVGARLGAFVPGGVFRFEVVVEEGAEPIGLPGGFVLIPASFFLAVDDEAEFAGMVGHAMGHVFLRHSLVTAGRTQEWTIPLVFMGGWRGVHANTRNGKSLVPATFNEVIRTNELEADRFGADLAGRAGYDPAGVARYFRRVQPEQSAAYSALPMKAVRLAALADTAERGGAVGGSEFSSVREKVRIALQGRVRKAPSLLR